MTIFTAWIATALVFGALDLIWLTLMTSRLYRPLLGDLLAQRTNVGAAVAFYLIYVTCLCALAVVPALERGGLARAAIYGALVGLVAYAAYDLTNQATLRAWDIRVALVDMSWGVIASAIAASAAYWIAARV
jgi:uncharacterized membrane protein